MPSLCVARRIVDLVLAAEDRHPCPPVLFQDPDNMVPRET